MSKVLKINQGDYLIQVSDPGSVIFDANIVATGHMEIAGEITVTETNVITITGGITTTIDTFSAAVADAVKYIMKIKDTITGDISCQDAMLVKGPTGDIYISEYGIINSAASLGSLTSSMTDGMITVSVIPSTANQLSIKLLKIYL